jgi:hypothetical protein
LHCRPQIRSTMPARGPESAARDAQLTVLGERLRQEGFG